MENVLVTGGCGFIGSNFIRLLLDAKPEVSVINLDLLTYAANPDSLKDIAEDPKLAKRYRFVKGDICDKELVTKLMNEVDTVFHFAAESHVDRSIWGPFIFTQTNVLGTHILLEQARLAGIKKFIHISTDEVYGSIEQGKFKESDQLQPNSPYSASKAGADMLARSYFHTYGFPVIITRSSNNYGSHQHPEKMIPLFITNLLQNKKVPLYGDGKNVRDWIYVLDNCEGILFAAEHGQLGETYNIGGGNELPNVELTEKLLAALGKGKEMIEYVKDRLGHDRRYALDCSKMHQLGWKPKHTFAQGLKETVAWYTNHAEWWKPLKQTVKNA